MYDTTLINALNKLVELSQDGEQGLLSSARDVSDPELAAVLRVRAQEYRNAFGELRALVNRLGGEPPTQGSVTATLQRGWKNVKANLAHDRDQAILEQCTRGEAYTRAMYGATLRESLPSEAYLVVATQYQAVVKHHDRFKRRCENVMELKFRRVGASPAGSGISSQVPERKKLTHQREVGVREIGKRGAEPAGDGAGAKFELGGPPAGTPLQKT